MDRLESHRDKFIWFVRFVHVAIDFSASENSQLPFLISENIAAFLS